MEKIWYIFVNGKQEGPYSFYDLKYDFRLTPDTLVWKEGFVDWIPIRKVGELKKLFVDEKPPRKRPQQTQEKKFKKGSNRLGKDEIAIDLRKDPPFLFWLLIGLVIFSFFLYKFMMEK